MLAVAFVRLLVLADTNEIQAMIKTTLAFWWAYALLLAVYVFSQPFYPGANQHQFFLSGILWFAVTLLLLSRQPARVNADIGLRRILLVTAVINVVLNLMVMRARSTFPFTLAILLVAVFWLVQSNAKIKSPLKYLGLPVALPLAVSPVLHLNSTTGNLVNEWSYPIFGKARTIEFKGREAAFMIWQDFARNNVSLLGPPTAELPGIIQETDQTRSAAQLGISPEQHEALRREEYMTRYFIQRQERLGLGTYTGITSSHNQWIDATAHSGVIYALGIAWAFCYVVWQISMRLSTRLPAGLTFAYWSMAVAWGIASQLDDRHWLYQDPYMTLFFLPVLAGVIRERQRVIHEQP